MKTFYSALILLFMQYTASAQNLYEIDLNAVKNDVLPVKLTLKSFPKTDRVTFSFPATVPGTYDTQDFGRFVLSMNAFDANRKKLKVTKQGNNSFIIANATGLKYLEYTVEDILDKKVKTHPVFAPVATNFMAGKNFIFNNGGIFGFINGEESNPIDIKITKPENFFGSTSLPQTAIAPTYQQFQAKSYHQLIDCPMMFCVPDTAQFYVGNTKVTLSVFDVQGVPRAKYFYETLKRDMQAIDEFLPNLPVDNYTFIVYVDDLREVGKALQGSMGMIKRLKLALKFKSLALGALEHGNSSTYYVANFGDQLPGAMKELSLESQFSGAAIHEFMHIITPLGLHSECIGNFNYINPVMSKHLWLYEGITEYFANYIKFKGGVYTPDEYLAEMQAKLKQGLSFPINEMSFTEMSSNVLQEKYHKQYGQVYQRGAVLGMLLDAEIQRLTNGKKSLIDVMLALNNRYGANRSFNEETFIQEFVKEVHPDLQQFFNLYIEGRNQWKPNDQLNFIGITYYEECQEPAILSPVKEGENDVVMKKLGIGLESVVVKTGPKEWAGLLPGDVVNLSEYREAFFSKDRKISEGDLIKLKIKRNGQPITLEFKARSYMQKRSHQLKWTPGK